jgi:hypothetical protein
VGPRSGTWKALTGRLSTPYARSTIADKLKGRSFPEWEFVEA